MEITRALETGALTPFSLCLVTSDPHSRRNMAEILPMRRKTLSNQSIIPIPHPHQFGYDVKSYQFTSRK